MKEKHAKSKAPADAEVSGLKAKLKNYEYYIKMLIQLLQPEEFHSLHECTIFDDDEKEHVFEIYKNLMITHRELLKAEILNNEKNNIATIQYAHTELKNIKPELYKIASKMQESWKRTETKGKARYFG
jgi:Trp operon repressor